MTAGRRGRPASDASRHAQVNLRLHATEAALVDQAATVDGVTRSEWVRRVAVRAALRTVLRRPAGNTAAPPSTRGRAARGTTRT